MKDQLKANRGITLIALIITIIVLLILAGITIAALSGENGILQRATGAKERTEIASEKEAIQIATLGALSRNPNGSIDKAKLDPELDNCIGSYTSIQENEGVIVTITDSNRSYLVDSNGNISEYELKLPIDPEEIPTGGDSTWTRANGTIDIQFLTGTSYTVGTANKPSIDAKNMVPVNWDATNSCWVVTDEADWDYSYGDTDTTIKWANVMLRDVLEVDGITDAKTATIAEMKGKTVTKEGSMLVWIPRYAYKITYYADSNKTGSPVGYSDARGLVDSTGKTPEGMNIPVTSIAVETATDNYYRPHPAFENGFNTGYTQGEWSSKLTGFWMGKFETTPKANGKITVLPNTASYRNQTIGTFYTDAQDLEIANSHMTKNSEWGAMAYLTESKYGRNGIAVARDSNNSSYLTGGTNGYKTSVDQSTTNNVYGIYDTCRRCM